MDKSEIYRQNFELFVRNVEKMDIFSEKIILGKKGFLILLAFKWHMTIWEKSQNQGGDRFARRAARVVENLLP